MRFARARGAARERNGRAKRPFSCGQEPISPLYTSLLKMRFSVLLLAALALFAAVSAQQNQNQPQGVANTQGNASQAQNPQNQPQGQNNQAQNQQQPQSGQAQNQQAGQAQNQQAQSGQQAQNNAALGACPRPRKSQPRIAAAARRLPSPRPPRLSPSLSLSCLRSYALRPSVQGWPANHIISDERGRGRTRITRIGASAALAAPSLAARAAALAVLRVPGGRSAQCGGRGRGRWRRQPPPRPLACPLSPTLTRNLSRPRSSRLPLH